MTIPESEYNSEYMIAKRDFEFSRTYLANMKAIRDKLCSRAVGAEYVLEKRLLQKEKGEKPIPVSFSWWRDIIPPFRRGNHYVLGGFAGVGKTTLATNVEWDMVSSGLKVWDFCLEMTVEEKMEMFAQHILQKEVITEDDWIKAYALIAPTGLRFYDPEGYIPWDKHLSIIEDSVRKENIDCVFIDNFHYLTRTVKDQVGVEGEASKRIKALAQELNIVIILLHHVRKPEGDFAEPEPSVHTLRGSSALLNDCSGVILLHHPLVSDTAEDQDRSATGFIRYSKGRYGKGGKRYVELDGAKRTYKQGFAEFYPSSKRRRTG